MENRELHFVCPFCGKISSFYTNINGGESGCEHVIKQLFPGKPLRAMFVKHELIEKEVLPIDYFGGDKMREVKFRAWDKINRRYYNVMYIDYVNKSVSVLKNNWDITIYIDIRFDDIFLEQYTGFKDNECKDIYEGDIIEYLEYTGYSGHERKPRQGNIMWNDIRGEWMIKRIKIDSCESEYISISILFNSNENKQFKIIGNIHEVTNENKA